MGITLPPGFALANLLSRFSIWLFSLKNIDLESRNLGKGNQLKLRYTPISDKKIPILTPFSESYSEKK